MTKINTKNMDDKMKLRLMQTESEIGRSYRDQLMNMVFGEPKKEREVVQVYKDELQSLEDRCNIAEIENGGWSSIIYEFVQKHNLWYEFANHLNELKQEQEDPNSDMYYGDLDYILLDYLPEGNKKEPVMAVKGSE
jgi:hypothetical protein